ncbi:MAG: hypothetical protein Q7T57_06585, partial [Dehalococcoidales bacterium]|nr:hypothetical protein [Dehalococcoidales bacterium]
MSHTALHITASLTLHALLRASLTDPLFSIREIDSKLLRHSGSTSGSGGTGHKKKSVLNSTTAQLNEQAARVKARQLMLLYATDLIDATKDEIRWLKDCGVLGKRAPKSSLMSATFLISLLREQSKTSLSNRLHNALCASKIGKWKHATPIDISVEEQAAEAEAQALASKQAAEDEEEEEAEAQRQAELEAAAAAQAEDEEMMGEGTSGEKMEDIPAAAAEPYTHPRRRSSASMKRKSGQYDDDGGDDDEGHASGNGHARAGGRRRA